MKNLMFFILLLPTSFLMDATLADITRAIKSGDANALGTYFDSQVEVAILDEEDTYSKSEAVALIKGFFDEYKPTSFSEVHQGASKGKDSQYCIGNMVAGSQNFRVYIYMKNVDGKTIIQEIRFDK